MADSYTLTSRLVWATDVHLNHLRHPHAARVFGKYLLDETQGEVFVLSGDISEAPELGYHLQELAVGLQQEPYFVLGNHDYYNGSFAKVAQVAANFERWLDRGILRKLTEKVVLVGHEGWYDAFYGDPYVPRFGMSDWKLIQDLKGLPGNPFAVRLKIGHERVVVLDRPARHAVIEACRARARAAVEQARATLLTALAAYPHVIFVTHVPPFEGATWHEGEVSDSTWVPWFSSKLMGDMLLEVARSHPDRKVLVLCGHTHSSGVYSPCENLQVLTGEAVYGAPDEAGILDIDDEAGSSIRMKLNKKWVELPIF